MFVVGDVGDQGADGAVGEFFGQFVASAFEAVAVARGNQHAGAEAEQLARDRQADAGAAAGYKRQLSVQSPAVRVHCGLPFRVGRSIAPRPIEDAARSEEHTSELQSLMRISYAVFCLKKKKLKIQYTNN